MTKTSKKVTKVGGGTSGPSKKSQYEIDDNDRSQAKKLRLFAALAWLIAIGLEIWAIYHLKQVPVNMTWLIVLIVGDLAFAVTGILLWKKSNRLSPASKKDKFKFFVQNQLGLIIAMICFLPLVILIFTNKNLDKKQKGIAGSVAVIALLVAGFLGVDLNPPSQEEYQEKLEQERLENPSDFDDASSVYWTKSGKSYHLFVDCSYINGVRTDEIFQGTVAQAKELKRITDICDRCQNRQEKEELADTSELLDAEVFQSEE